MKPCPFCAEEIQDAAVVCKHCGRSLDGSDETPVQESSARKGFNATCGVLLALFLVFTVLPLGACIACGGGLAAIGTVLGTQPLKETPKAEPGNMAAETRTASPAEPTQAEQTRTLESLDSQYPGEWEPGFDAAIAKTMNDNGIVCGPFERREALAGGGRYLVRCTGTGQKGQIYVVFTESDYVREVEG